MKWKFWFIIFVIFYKCPSTKPADLFDDQPKILVNDGNLVFESADSRNIAIKLKGKSRFLVNDVDVLEILKPRNATNAASGDSSDAIQKLSVQVAKLRQMMKGQNGVLNRLDRVEQGIPANATIPGGSLRTRINGLQRRVISLELKVANLTERLTRDHCKSYPCQNGGTCFNMFETYRCECPSNWEGPSCNVDVNECARYVGTDLGCQNGATCINIPGSYQCSCVDPWKGQNCNRQTVDCLKVPASEICGHGTCIQVSSKLGFSCICEQGWRQSNETQACSIDVDECKEMRPHCSNDPKVFCINTPGSFVCGPCPAGFNGNGYTCVDIDECEVNNGGCSISPNVECINTRGSYRCANCPLGYDGDGKTCLPSAYRPGFQCSDSSFCNENAICTQYPNSPPTCSCKPGFSGSGIGSGGCLASSDPCLALNCKNGGVCVRNGTTSMYCQCPRGTSPPLCDRIDFCASNPCQNGGICTNNIRRFGPRRFSCACPKSFNGPNCENQVRKCGGLLTDWNGTLSYPPDQKSNYIHNARCAWLIKTNHTKVLSVTFKKFDLEVGNDCKFDWLQIHDGRSSSSYMIGRFCGNTLPKNGNIISTHNQLYLWFRSDNTTAHEGFELTWDSVDPICGGDMNVTTHGTISSPGSPGNYPINRDCEWFITAPPGKRIQFVFYTLMIESHVTCEFDFVEVHSGLGSETPSLGKFCNSSAPPPLMTPSHTATIHFHSDGDSTDAGFQIAFLVVEGVPGCGGIYTSPRGDISSPNNIADGKYKHNILCDYIFQMPTDSRIRIEFKKFSLEESAGCKFDKIEIFEGSVYDEEYLIGRYCGTNMPPLITSLTNIVTLRFMTDWSTNDDGFQFQYQLVCGGIHTADNGIISTPNYPSPYAGERTCEYDISAPQGKVIVLTVIDLDVEKHSVCEFDNLEIFDGAEADNATSLGRYCGDVKPGIFTSTYNHLHVHFSSDASINGRGFLANYTFIDVSCGGLVKDPSEIIKSPIESDGTGLYKSNAECRWLIFAPKGFVIQINFISFELESDSTCKYDFLQVFNNGSGRGEEMGRFCGTNAPKIITTVDNIATILFKTDSSTAKEGFSISLAFIEGSKLCGGHFVSSHGVIRSPGRPEYLSNKECEWTVTVPNGQQLAIQFNYFEMEAHATCRFDGLEIRNGGNSFAPLVGKFCGTDIPPPFKSFGNQLYFKFTSDSSRGGKGFEIEWDGASTGCGGVISTMKGSISSPSYPNSYAHNAQCEWRVSVNEGMTIEIIFTDLDMESHAECNYDYLEIFDGPDASSTSLGKFCSSENHPMHLETVGNHALIRMNTDDSHSGRGFFLKYSSKCNRTIFLDSGVLESPNFPDDYPNNMHCVWTIVVSRGNKINMQFSHFDFENDKIFHNETNEHVCKYDYLEIYDKNLSEDNVQGQKMVYCNSAPEPRISSTNAVVVSFHSDSSTVSNGFRLEWFVEGCGGVLTHPQGELLSPNFPKKYSHEVTCIWEINVDFGNLIEVTVNEIDLESSNKCDFDVLNFSNDRNFTNHIAGFCEAQDISKVVTSESHRLFVKFNSDETNNGRGFNATYKSVLASCGGKMYGSSGTISSKGYPSQNYENNHTCEWNIKTDPSHSIKFQLLDFDLESSENCSKDYLEIYDPVFKNILWKGCGNPILNQTVFNSKRNELNIILHSDDSINAKGFRANFTDSCGARILVNDSGSVSFRRSMEDYNCTWTFISADPTKKVTITFTYAKIFIEGEDGCFSKILVFDGDSDSGSLKKSFCGSKTPPAITSNGNALTVKLNTTSMSLANEFDVHYSVLDNACGGIYTSSIHGEFASPNYPDSSPLNSYCVWSISASSGNKISLTIKSIDISTSPSCNEAYLEIRKNDRNGPLVGVFCSSEIPANLDSASSFWIKYQTDSDATSGGFLAEFKYVSHSDLEGTSGVIESPSYPMYFSADIENTYRILVSQGSVIRIEFPEFFMDEEEEDDCYAYIKIHNGFDTSAPILKDETCGESPEALTTETNVAFIEFNNQFHSKTKFRITWKEITKVFNGSAFVSACGDSVISLDNVNTTTNITSPGYPFGYEHSLKCSWTIVSGLPGYHPEIFFNDVDLEDDDKCIADYVTVSSDRDDGSWRDGEKICSTDLRTRRIYHGTPNLKIFFNTDYSTNKTGFNATTYLDCGGAMTDSEGIIEYNAKYFALPYRTMNDCMWNITVRQGRTIKFEFIQLNIKNHSTLGTPTVMIRNGIDDSSPLLGEGQFFGSQIPKDIPVTSSNRAFVKYKSNIPILNSFKVRYSEVQHECGGQIRLSLNSNNSKIISTPNYPNMPSPHIECSWMIIAPIGEKVRIDFLERFDLFSSRECDKQYVELRDGLTSASQLIGTFCRDKPTTKYSKSNILMIKYFNDISEPGNGFKANISIGICGGFRKSRMGYLTSPKYPGLGAYPSNANCDYRISGPSNIVFNITFNEIDLPEKNETVCDLTKDHIKIFSVIPQFNANGSELLIDEGTFCGNNLENSSIISSSSEISIQFNTFKKSKNIFKGFKLFYNASSTSCGGSIDGESGVITSPGYPSKTLSKSVCQWKITVPKGKRVKIEFEDVDFIKSKSAFMQRVGVYNDFLYSNRMKFISNDTIPEPLYSSDNKIMIVMWVRIPSSNRGFKLKFSSEVTTICSGDLNADSGGWSSPTDVNLTSYSCEFVRGNKDIIPSLPNVGTISYYFKNIAAGKRIPNCRYASTVINVKRRSGKIDDENTLARICGNETVSQTVLSPFADVSIEVRKSPYYGQLNYTMVYKTHKCGGLISGGGESFIRNPPKEASNEKVVDCAWFGRFTDGYSVSISIEKLNLSLPCEKEYIQIFNGPTALSPTIGKYCGTEFTKEKIVSESNTVYIEYHTDNFKENSKDSVFEIKLTESSFGCGGILSKGITTFKTPLYEKPYPPNTECIWEIRGEPGYHIGLTFIDRFFIESSQNCTKDYVEVFDFVDDDWKSLGRKCNRDVPKPFNSTSDKMKVIFRSDEATNGDGFSAVWNQNCGGIIEVTPKMNILSSPGFPKNYGSSLTCNYTLKAPSIKSFINFNFLEFNIETTGTKCHYDNITIYKRPDYAYESNYYEQEKVGTYCGLRNPGKFRHRGISSLIFRSDRWVERKGFQIEYKLDECGGDVTESSLIESPEIDIPTTGFVFLGTLYCTWNITAPADKKIVIKFTNFSTEHSEFCSFDYVDIFNGSLISDPARLAKICGNLTSTLKPIVIDNNKALIRLKTDQTNQYGRFSAAIMFKPKCDEIIELTEKQKSFTLDKTNRVFNESMECVFKIRAEPLSSIKVAFNQLHLSICDPDQNVNKGECDCNFLEILDGNGPFSETIKKVCGHDLPLNVISSHSSLYIRFVTSGVRVSTGFSMTFTMIQSPCGSVPHLNFTANSTTMYLTSPVKSSDLTYPPNLRCMWIAEAPFGKMFEIRFTKFDLQDSENCANDSLTLEDNSVKDSIPEGLGEEIIYRGKSRQALLPSFYNGITGPIAPHVYCGSEVPHDYISQTNKIKILFETDSLKEFSGFNLSISTANSCSRNFTSLQGRLLSTDTPENCKTTIKVPENYTITVYFHRFYFYENDCLKAFLKVYDGSFEDGVLMKTFCGYATPDPIFSTRNQLSLIFNYGDESPSFSRGSYDIMYLATDKGQGCGGEVFNYGGVFTSPLYPYNAATNRSSYDCTWTIKVPQNLKVAVRFSIFDMGSNIFCTSEFVELIEENSRGEKESIRRFCGEDEPANYVSTKSIIQIHYVQTRNFPGTGWILNFIGVHEGSEPQNW